MTVEFTVPGRIGGKGRTRATIVGGHARVYTPQKTRSAEAIVRHFASEAMNGTPLLEGAVKLEMTVWLNQPKSWSKKRKAETSWVTGKPDADNSVKLVADSLNSIVFRDDAQIAALDFTRLYTDGPERVLVRVTALEAA